MAKYLVAKSYQGMEQIGEPFDKNGKPYIKVKGACDRCGGSGRYGWGAMINGNPQYAGVCFKCNGVGFLTQEVRVYTERQFESMENKKKAAAACRERKRLERERKARAEWPSKNGFNDESVTYIFLVGNTYDIKDELKEVGYKYNKELGWHGPARYEKDGYVQGEVKFEDVYKFCGDDFFPTFKGEEVLKEMRDSEIEKVSTSRYMGEVKERLRNMNVVLEAKNPCNGLYADWVYKFRTEDGNLCCWFTKKDMNYELGAELVLTGTVTKHDNYNGECETFLNRCIIKER